VPFSMEFDLIKIGNPFSPHDKQKTGEYPPHTRIFTLKGLVNLLRFHGFKIEKISASGYLPMSCLANIDPWHARFIMVKVRK